MFPEQEHQISGWIAASAEGLQGRGLPQRNDFSQTPVVMLMLMLTTNSQPEPQGGGLPERGVYFTDTSGAAGRSITS